MKMKFILFILILLVFVPQLVLASSQSLTYDNPTNQVNTSYDQLNRILTKNSSSVNITYAYDEQYQGTLTNITFGNSTYKYEYDDKLRVTREIKIIDGIQFEKRNYYDSMDRLVKQVLIPGEDINYYYNNQGKISKLLNFTNSTYHNAFDNPLNRTYANPKTTGFTYDNQNARLTQIKTGNNQQLDYSYDAVGNVIMINDSANNRTYRMTYDFLDRLVNATINSNTYIYSYNAIGNILKIVKDSTNTTKFVYGNIPVHAPSQIITGEAGIDVHKQAELYSTNKIRILEFYLADEKNVTITGTNWTIGFGDNTLVNSTVPFNISTNETVLVIVENNYTNAGDYRINVTGRSTLQSLDWENVNIKFGIKTPVLSVLSQNVTLTTFEFPIYNDMNVTSQNVSWSCNEGISSTIPFTMSGYEYTRVFIEHNYTSGGGKRFSCTANSTDGNDTKSIDFEIKEIKIEDYNASSTAENNRSIRFTIKNYYYPSTITWYITTDGQTFQDQVTLSTGESANVSRNINYTIDGSKTILVNISSGNITDRYNESFILRGLRIEDYDSYNLNETNKLMTFIIKNYWSQNMSANWNISDPIVSSNTVATLVPGESVFVFIENNYTTQGKKTPTINTYSGSFSDSFTDRFFVKMIEIVRYLVLSEGQNIISEILARNNLGLRNVSWNFDTGQENISSSQSILMNISEEVPIIIEANYTGAGIYSSTSTINSSSYNDTTSGISIT